LVWGFGPDHHIVNARSEGVSDRAAFEDAFRRRRALVPADGFYEWRKTPAGRLPVAFSPRSRRPFAFAGIWENGSFTILTTDANEEAAPVHDRMPVIVRREDERLWLDPHVTSPERLEPILSPFPSGELEARDVSTAVNSVANDGPECLEAP